MSAAVAPQKAEKLNVEQAGVNDQTYIKVVLTSHNVKLLESVCSSLVTKAVSLQRKVKGPIRLPTRKMSITTRRSPNGEGTNTWDKFEMRLHKRIVFVYAGTQFIKEVMEIFGDPAIDVVVTTNDTN